MDNICALINDPGNSREFIRYTALLASDLQTDVKLLYVQNPQAYPLGTPETLGWEVSQVRENLLRMGEAAEETINGFISEITKEEKMDISMEFQPEIGNASIILEDKVSEGTADMVMIQGQPEEGVWGQTSTNMEIIRNVACPIWILPPDAVYRPLKHIIYATDYQEEDVPTLKKLVSLTEPFSPRITALHVVNDRDFESKVREEGFDGIIRERTGSDRISVKTTGDHKDLDVTEILRSYAEKKDADLVVVLKENRHFLERIFKKSFTRELIRKLKLPVLVYHEKKS